MALKFILFLFSFVLPEERIPKVKKTILKHREMKIMATRKMAVVHRIILRKVTKQKISL